MRTEIPGMREEITACTTHCIGELDYQYGVCDAMAIRSGDQETSVPRIFQGPRPDSDMELILWEISVVGRHLVAMDTKIMDLSADSKSIRADIAGFHDKVTDLDHRRQVVENRMADLPDHE
ncbi:hypothetical protein NDU88_001284 [Pleurodeles waltl]|uniref:Uncharacterized protein n=1 Tax=Pleurodeles waltl TaxID=8319 RepID=A0AAV7NC57_PLEWA|nr:hypothetical protein NDU88_001284 [Pleurodeles waltl]